MSEELIPETPEQETEENEAAEAIKQRKNGLYPAVSDELAENMKSGWADTELHDLQPIPQAEGALQEVGLDLLEHDLPGARCFGHGTPRDCGLTTVARVVRPRKGAREAKSVAVGVGRVPQRLVVQEGKVSARDDLRSHRVFDQAGAPVGRQLACSPAEALYSHAIQFVADVVELAVELAHRPSQALGGGT